MKKILNLKWNQIAIALLIGLALGVLIGGRQGGKFFHHRWKEGGMKQHMMEKFSKELRLSAEQKKQVGAIFDKAHPQMEALQAEMRPKFEALRNSTDAQIKQILNADQQKKFDEMHAKMEERWKEHKKFPGQT